MKLRRYVYTSMELLSRNAEGWFGTFSIPIRSVVSAILVILNEALEPFERDC